MVGKGDPITKLRGKAGGKSDGIDPHRKKKKAMKKKVQAKKRLGKRR
jgi:hypothetical protein